MKSVAAYLLATLAALLVTLAHPQRILQLFWNQLELKLTMTGWSCSCPNWLVRISLSLLLLVEKFASVPCGGGGVAVAAAAPASGSARAAPQAEAKKEEKVEEKEESDDDMGFSLFD